jgi:hypothetical protein
MANLRTVNLVTICQTMATISQSDSNYKILQRFIGMD